MSTNHEYQMLFYLHQIHQTEITVSNIHFDVTQISSKHYLWFKAPKRPMIQVCIKFYCKQIQDFVRLEWGFRYTPINGVLIPGQVTSQTQNGHFSAESFWWVQSVSEKLIFKPHSFSSPNSNAQIAHANSSQNEILSPLARLEMKY